MSPITHALTGWLIAQPLPTRRDRILVTTAAIIPDIDGLSLVVGVEAYQKYHHTFGHNLLFGILVLLFLMQMGNDKRVVVALGFTSFHSHLIADLIGSGSGWGIPFLWPFSNHESYSLPPFQWELDSWQNFFFSFFCLIAVAWFGVKKGRTIIEVFSTKTDQRIVASLRNRFSKK